MTRKRTIAVLVAIAGLCAFFVTGASMARQVADYYDAHGRELFIFQPIMRRHFAFAGHDAHIEDAVGDAGQLIVRVRYAGDTVELTPSLEPGHADLPALVRHKDWLRALRFAPARGLTKAEFEAGLATGEIKPRAVIVVRRPPPGAGEQTYARVWRTEWTYRFLELVPGEGITSEILRYPTTDADEPLIEGELAPGTWQFEAALGSWGFDPMAVMAPHAAPSAASARHAIEAAGLMLPGATASLLVAIGALAIGFAPRRATRSAHAG